MDTGADSLTLWYTGPMPIPDFTDEERYLIDGLKSQGAAGASQYMAGYLIGAAVLAGFAFYSASLPMMAVAFLLVVGFRIYEELNQRRWTPIWRSIIEKYEEALHASVKNASKKTSTTDP